MSMLSSKLTSAAHKWLNKSVIAGLKDKPGQLWMYLIVNGTKYD